MHAGRRRSIESPASLLLRAFLRAFLRLRSLLRALGGRLLGWRPGAAGRALAPGGPCAAGGCCGCRAAHARGCRAAAGWAWMHHHNTYTRPPDLKLQTTQNSYPGPKTITNPKHPPRTENQIQPNTATPNPKTINNPKQPPRTENHQQPKTVSHDGASNAWPVDELAAGGPSPAVSSLASSPLSISTLSAACSCAMHWNAALRPCRKLSPCGKMARGCLPPITTGQVVPKGGGPGIGSC